MMIILETTNMTQTIDLFDQKLLSTYLEEGRDPFQWLLQQAMKPAKIQATEGIKLFLLKKPQSAARWSSDVGQMFVLQ